MTTKEDDQKRRMAIEKSTRHQSSTDSDPIESYSDTDHEEEEKEEELKEEHKIYLNNLYEQFIKLKKDYALKNHIRVIKEWTFGNEDFYDDLAKMQSTILKTFGFCHSVKHLKPTTLKAINIQKRILKISDHLHKAYDLCYHILGICYDDRSKKYGIVKEPMEIPE
jgi:hypothetical protein